MLRKSGRASVLALAALCTFLCGEARALLPPYSEVHTVSGPGEAVPLEFTLNIGNAGTYQVTLTDLGAAMTPAAPLKSVKLAITAGSAVTGTPLGAAGSTNFNATAGGSYVIHVIGTPGTAPGSGPVGITVTDAGHNVIDTFSGTLAPPPGTVAQDTGVLQGSFTVTGCPNPTPCYQVTLADYSANLSQPALSTLILAITVQGGALVATLPAAGTTTVYLAAGTYDIFAIGQSSNTPPSGLFGASVTPAAGGTAVFSGVTPVGAVTPVASPGLAPGNYTFTLADVGYPNALSQVAAVVTLQGQTVASLTAPGSTPFTASANTYEVFAFGVPSGSGAGNTAGTGSYAVTLQRGSDPAALGVARAVAATGAVLLPYSFDGDITSGGSYTLTAADFAFPAPLQSVNVAAVQSGKVVGTALTAAGSANLTAASGPVSFVAFVQPGNPGSLFGISLASAGGGSTVFEATQGASTMSELFSVRQVSITAGGTYGVTVADVGFPAPLANLAVIVTQGTNHLGSIYTAGSFSFAATPGNYFVNFIAQPGGADDAGTYALAVALAPVVTLKSSVAAVAAGETVQLTWTSQNSTACTASDGWSGSQSLSGSATTPPINQTTTFTLTCSGDGGSTSQSVKVTVNAPAKSGGGGGGALGGDMLLLLATLVWLRLSRIPRNRALPLAVLAMATLLAACGGPQSRFASYVLRGNTHYAQGDFKRASLEFRNAMQINPRDTGVRLLAGQAAEKTGQVRQAAALYQSVLDLDEDNVAARASLARLFALGGAPQRALDTLQPGLARHPDDPALLTVRASARAQLKDFAGAAADADRALKLAPDNEDALALRAGLYQKAGDTAAAVALISGAVQRHPESVDLREVLANLYVLTEETGKAEEQLAALMRLKPRELRYRAELAIYLTRNHRIDDAQRALEEAVRVLPESDNAKLTLVNFIAAQRTRAEAEKTLRRFIDRQPDNYTLRFALGDMLSSGGAAAEALAVYNEVIRRDGTGPSGLIARDRIAGIYLAQRRTAEANKLLQEVLDRNPHDDDALFMRGQMALERSDAVAAVADLRAVLRENPQSVPVERLLARAYIAQGAPGLAEEALRAAMDVAPQDTALRLEYAQLLLTTGRYEQGIGMLEETVRANPQDSSAREALVNARLTQREFGAALAAARDLETLRPDYAVAPYLAGLALQGLGRSGEAQQAFERSLALKPGAIEPLTALAHLEVEQGHGAAAIERVQGAIKAAPSDPAPLNLLGETYIALKDYARAHDTLQRAVKLAPQWWPAYRTLALAQLGQHDTAGAIATYEAALQVAPAEPQLVIELGHLYVQANRIDDAIRHYEALYQRNPRLQIAANNLALLLITFKSDRGSLDRARDLTAGFASSENGALLDTNGWVHVRRQEYEAALPVLERASQRAPQDHAIRYHLAMAQMHLGQTDRARTNLEAALAGPASYPWSADARAALARL